MTDRPGHDRRYAIDPQEIEQELGRKPQETFEAGIRHTVAWYLDHQPWVRAVTSGGYRDGSHPVPTARHQPRGASAVMSGGETPRHLLAGGSGTRLYPATQSVSSNCCRCTTSP